VGKFISIGGKFAGVEKYEKKNGIVSYYIKYKDLNNNTVREKAGDSPEMNQTKAREKLRKKQIELNEQRSQIKNGSNVEFYIPKTTRHNTTRMTLNDLAQIYIANKKGTKDFFNIKSKYKTHIEKHDIASKPIVLIVKDDIKKFIEDKKNTFVIKNGMQRKRKQRPTRDKSGIVEYIETEEEYRARQYKLTNSTVNAIYGIIVSIVNYAIKEEHYRGINPFHGSYRLDVSNVKLKYLNNSESVLFLRQLKWQSEAFEVMDRYVYLIGLLAMTTAARRKTILSIRVGDVDFENGILNLCNFKVKDNWYSSAIATEEIKELLKKFSKGKKPDDYIFASSRSEKQINKYPAVMKKILDITVNIHRKKDDRMTLRDLRNSLASNLAIAGVPLTHIGKVLDHKSITSTQRYAQLIPDVATVAIKDYVKGIQVKEEKD
jgi:integrase